MSDGKLFQSRGAAAVNVLSPKELCVQPTTSVRVSAAESFTSFRSQLRNYLSARHS